MTFEQTFIIETRYLTKPSKRRSGRLIAPGVKFIVAHDTGNPGSTAIGNVSYYEKSRDAESASAHIFVDDKRIIECIPATTGTPEKAWHVLYNVNADNRMYGYDADDAAIGVEYCYGGTIDADAAYRKYVWTIAYLCFLFRLDPARAIVGHAFLDPTRKTDPVSGLAHSRRSYEQLLRDIPAEYQRCTAGAIGNTQLAPTRAGIAGTVVATTKLNIRKGRPSRLADVAQTVPSGTQLNHIGWTDDGEPVNGNSRWYIDTNQNYFWSGATQ